MDWTDYSTTPASGLFLPLSTQLLIRYEEFTKSILWPISMIQAFLPLLRRAKGRIVNTCSVVDHLSPPFAGVLASSKAAFASVSSSLRRSCAPRASTVIVVEPGSVDTPLLRKPLAASKSRSLRCLLKEPVCMRRSSPNGGRVRQKRKSRKLPGCCCQSCGKGAECQKARTRYPAGKDSIMLITLARLLPEKLLDLAILKAFGLPTKFGQAVE